MSKTKYNWVFVCVFLIQLFLLLFYMKQKSGYFIDELWSYSYANSYNEITLYPFTSSYDNDKNDLIFNKWVLGKRFLEYLTVQQGERFAYKKVTENHALDANPPIYSYILHTLCSFFPNKFSPWFGYFINLLCFVSIQVLLLKISYFIFNNKIYSLLPCLIYGFSICSINTFVYIRMYALSTLFFLLTVYLHYDFYLKRHKVKILYLSLVTLLASLIHYHFLIFQFFLTIITCIFLFANKQAKLAFLYGLSILFSVCLLPVIYPNITNLFVSVRGVEAANNISKIFYLSNLSLILEITLRQIIGLGYNLANAIGLYCSELNIYFFIIIFTIIMFKRNMYNKILNYNIIALTLPTLCMSIIIAPMVCFMGLFSARYFFPLFPFICIIVCKIITLLLNRSIYVYIGIILLFCIMSHINNMEEFTLGDLFEINRKQLSSDLKEANAIVCLIDDKYIHSFSDVLMNCKKIMPTRNNKRDIELLVTNLKKESIIINDFYFLILNNENITFIQEYLKNNNFNLRFLYQVRNHVKIYNVYKIDNI